MSDLPNISDLDECPFCDSELGFYAKVYISGFSQDNTLFDGEPHNHDMHEHLSYKVYQTKKCLECDKTLSTKENGELTKTAIKAMLQGY